MNIEQIEKGLLAKYEQSRIVFWQDSEAEFTEVLPELKLPDVTLLNLDTASHFSVKYQLEQDQTSRFLLYATADEPTATRDWLFDIKLYAQHFYADSSSIILNELGMRLEFRQAVSRYKKFFANKQRFTRLKKVLPTDANVEQLTLAMLAVVLKSETATFTQVMQQLLLCLAEGNSDEVLEELAKFELLPALAQQLEQEFGYRAAEPTVLNLTDLLSRLLATDFYHALAQAGVEPQSRLLQTYAELTLPDLALQTDEFKKRFAANSPKRATVLTFVGSWRESRVLSESYNQLAASVQDRLEIRQRLTELTSPADPSIRVRPDLLGLAETFEVIEQSIITMLAKQLPALDSTEVESLISRRLLGHWCYQSDNYQAMYKAIRAAKQFYDLQQRYSSGFYFENAKALYQCYETELFQFDSCYRVFSENAFFVSQNGSDILKLTGLVEDIENRYVHGFLHDLAIAWGKLIDQEKLLTHWQLSGVPNQHHFYQRQVKSVLENTMNKRVFVIISDALRFDVAHELMQQINDEKRFKAELKSQLGVVPSYTQLGMSALLPHQTLTVQLTNKVEYKADGLSTHGLENRQKVLANYKGIAVKATDVLNWTNQEGRDKVKDAEVVYIYHDDIDAIGDKAATEDQTFQACRDAIENLKNLIARIINRLNGSRVLITADHGFIFKTTEVSDTDKTALKALPASAVEAKKRYVIGSALPKDDYYWTGKLAATAGISDNAEAVEFMVPRGSNRFHFVGGARFIHGGVMPQEICVPILSVRELDTKAQSKFAKQPVNVVPLNSPIKIVANIDKVQLLQTEAVGEKFKARELMLWIEDPTGKVVSTREKMVFESSSDKMEDRQQGLQITLSGSGFNRATPYKLVLLDLDTNLKYNSFSVTIDLAFEDDFF
jgi:uncharacterized protein (TIGR02687 family)